MDERGWQQTAAARPDAWDEVLRAHRRLDRAPMRRLVKAVLRSESPTLLGLDIDLVASDPLRGWRRLGDALTRDLCDPLDDYVRALDRHDIDALLDATGRIPPSGAAALDWPARADGAVRSLIDLVPDDHPDRGALVALVLTFCYLECIVFWEHTTAHAELATILRAVGHHADAAVTSGAGAAADRPARLLVAVERACRALRRELVVEQAWSCACPPSVTRAAGSAVEALTEAAAALEHPLGESAGTAAGDPALRTLLEGLEIVLAESITDARLYVALLHDHIGPAATAFAVNLANRSGDDAVVDPLRVAIEAVDHALDESTVPHIGGVFRSETRTQRRSLAAMLEIVGGAEGPAVPTLVVDQGELHYLFPFGLPVDADGEDFVQKALTEHAGAGASPSVADRPKLAGCSVTIEDALQSEVFHHASVAYEAGPVGAGVRLTFADHRLVLETAAGVRFAGIDVEVLLGPLNNHVVRIVVTTDVVPRLCTVGGAPAEDEPTDDPVPVDPEGADPRRADRCDGRFERLPGAWTPHDLDQFLHRGGTDFGDERLYFVKEDEAGEGDAVGGHTHPEPNWASFIELAATIVNDLHREVAEFDAEQRGAPADEPGGGTRPPAPAPLALDVDERASLLRQQSHIVVVVTAASAVLAGERRPLPTATALAGCRGGAALFGPQPPAPRSLEEWTSAPPVATEDLADRPGIVANMDSQIRCHGDTTLMFVPSSPNWQIIEDQDLIVFALSLGSAYQLGRERLLASSDLAARLDSPEDLAVYRRKELDDLARQVRATERRLNDQIGFADRLSGHARSAAVIRPRRDRALIDHITTASGVDEMQSAMTETRGVAADRLDDLRDMIARIAEAQHRRGQSWIERFLLTVAVLAFVDVVWFFFDIHRDFYDGWTTYFFVVLGVLVLAATGIAAVVFRNAPRPIAETSSSGTASRSPIARTGIGSTAATRASRASKVGSAVDSSTPSQER